MRRRILPITVLLAVALAATSGCASSGDAAAPSADREASAAPTSPAAPTAVSVTGIDAIEAEYDVRVGITAISDDGRVAEYAADERFGYASTLKVFVAAAALSSASADELGASIRWTPSDVDAAGYSPVTSERVDSGMTLAELAEAAVRASDNTAANLVMDAAGGPSGVESYLRELGDQTTVVTEREPALNTVTPGSDANTTTPRALAQALQQVFESGSLSPERRSILLDWMSGNATGDALIRAGAPSGWSVADKSGGAGGMRNDIAVVTTEEGTRIYLAVLTVRNDPAADYSDAAVEQVARAVLAAFGE